MPSPFTKEDVAAGLCLGALAYIVTAVSMGFPPDLVMRALYVTVGAVGSAGVLVAAGRGGASQ